MSTLLETIGIEADEVFDNNDWSFRRRHGFSVLEDESQDTGRWEDYRRCVVIHEPTKTTFAFDYSVGLTEMQDQDEYATGADLYEVTREIVKVIKYTKVS